MSPEVIAAIIAASVSFVTLIGTLAAQFFGYRATSRDTETTLREQREQLDKTLAEQREQLDRTLAEQSKQLDRTLAEQRTRTQNERFATAADKLGSDKPPAVRLAGVYAMAGLADDWEENRQTCINVLCAYLHIPYEPDPGDKASAQERLNFLASREVRHTVIEVITAHLKDDAATSWRGLNFNFIGVVFDGGSFADARFSGGTVDFGWAQFPERWVDFSRVEFSCRKVNFGGAKFFGGTVDFKGAKFSDGVADFGGAEFRHGEVRFMRAEFAGGTVNFSDAEFAGGMVDFSDAKFSGGTVDFSAAADWSHPPTFGWDGLPPHGVKLPAATVQNQP